MDREGGGSWKRGFRENIVPNAVRKKASEGVEVLAASVAAVGIGQIMSPEPELKLVSR